MNKELLETQWAQVRQILKDKFSNLTEEDIRQINGHYDQLVAKLQQKYGYTREEAEERIRNWNFDRFTTNARDPFIRNERERLEEERIKEDDNSSFLKWLLIFGIPLVLLGSYFLTADRMQDMSTTTAPTTPVIQERVVTQSPADLSISNSLRDTFVTQANLAAEAQNVNIVTNNGVVTLSGQVSTNEVRDSFGTVAKNFVGVTRVINNIQVK